VVAVEAGVVVLVENFTGPNAADPSPWWNDTQAVLIEGASGVVTYGEITAKVVEGQRVEAGDLVGVVDVSVLRNYKGRPMTMLHLELMVQGSRSTLWWRRDEERPAALLDPTPKLLEAAGPNLLRFDLTTYDGVEFR
jgi:murein DD-endopeptidase MepM/ murein hydrolase activator NlpD